jgi:hypothetical protein
VNFILLNNSAFQVCSLRLESQPHNLPAKIRVADWRRRRSCFY